MEKIQSNKVKIFLNCLTSNLSKLTTIFIRMYCQDIAEIVANPEEADTEIFYIDNSECRIALETQKESNPNSYKIVFSLYDYSDENVFLVKKPIEKEAFRAIILEIKNKISLQHIAQTEPEQISIPLPKLWPEQGQAYITTESTTADFAKTEINQPDEVESMIEEFSAEIQKPIVPDIEKSYQFDDRRKSQRYYLQSITAKVVPNSLLNKRSLDGIEANVVNISSTGVLIQVTQQEKLSSKVTLKLYLNALFSIDIPAQIIHKYEHGLFALTFNTTQHKLIDYFVDTGKAFINLDKVVNHRLKKVEPSCRP